MNNQDEVSERGRAFWRVLSAAEQDIRNKLGELTHRDVILLAAELRDLTRVVASEVSRREELARAAGVVWHDGKST